MSPPTLLLRLSLYSLILTAVLPSHLSLRLNSSLRPSVTTPPWTILGMILTLIPLSTHLCLFLSFFWSQLKKAYGPDGLPPIFHKNCASVLTPYQFKLFRLYLSTSTFPSCWKYAFIQPVPKKGDGSNPSNYQPIALHSSLYKEFESILNRKTQNHPSTSDLLSDRQYGFRKGRSTGDLLTLITDS